VSCVTALRRVAGRSVTTVEGLPPDVRNRWVDAFVATGASQCGFCTPGILLRLAALTRGNRPPSREAVESALLAHLCRCTGWQSIVDAACIALGLSGATPAAPKDPLLASWRAQVEGPAFQSSGRQVVLGGGGFADDTAPEGALVALGAGDSVPARSLAQARQGSSKVQGRNSTVPLTHPVPVPPGEWAIALQTTWVEPAYVEPDASWCTPTGRPHTPLANGGAFGGKRSSPAPGRAQALASQLDQPVRVLWSREDVVRYGPKRPPIALGLRGDGTGVLRLGRPAGTPDLSQLHERVRAVAPGVDIEEIDIVGPPVGADLRGAGWVETLAGLAALGARADRAAGWPTEPGVGRAEVTLPSGGRAAVQVEAAGTASTGASGRGRVGVQVWAGEPLCPVTLRSYVLGAVHQALGLVWSEGIAVSDDGEPVDLTIRSFGILAARDMPEVEVSIQGDDRWPVNGSDAVFAATVAAAWIAEGLPSSWPTRRGGARESAASPSDREEHQSP
jgi:2Fe-2S iron-sulfur cluster protein